MNPAAWMLLFFPREYSDLHHAVVDWTWTVDGRRAAEGETAMTRKRFPYLVEADYQADFDPQTMLAPLATARRAELVVDGPRLR